MLLLPANNPSPWTGPTGNNTYLITGGVSALIDAGIGEPAHLDALAEALAGESLGSVLITHAHPDHIGGLAAIAARWPNIRVVRYGEPIDGPIQAGSAVLRAVHTPGHSPDHLCFFDEASRDLYCGDLVRSGGSIVIPGSKGGSVRHYLDSLARIRALSPRRLLPGHGPIIADPVAVIDGYVRHRLQREEQVLAALGDGLMAPAQITSRVYGPLSPELAAAAEDTVLAHLVKLHDDGRAFVSDDGWRLSYGA